MVETKRERLSKQANKQANLVSNPNPLPPPVEHQWKPGQSGNPGGRPKTKPYRDAIRRLVEAAGDDTQKLDQLAQALYTKALEGDVSALKEIADRLDGKVPQGIIGGEDDDPDVKISWLARS